MSINNTSKRRLWICFLTALVCIVFFAAAAQAAPTIKNVTLDKTTFQPGNGVLRVQADAECQDSVTYKIRILNAAGKTVYLNKAGTGKGPQPPPSAPGSPAGPAPAAPAHCRPRRCTTALP